MDDKINTMLMKIVEYFLTELSGVPPFIIVLFDRQGMVLAIQVSRGSDTDEFHYEILAEHDCPDGQGTFMEPVMLVVSDQTVGHIHFTIKDGKLRGPTLH